MAVNPKKLMIVGLGALSSCLVVVMLLSAALGPKEPKVAAADDGVQVLVATRDMKPGDILDPKNSAWRNWDEKKVYKGMITREKGADTPAEGKLKRALAAGEPITDAAVVSDKDASMMTALLKPGMRAVGVKVNAETSAGGFIMPGDYVDVVLSHKIRTKSDSPEAMAAVGVVDENVSETIISGLQVLAIDQKSEKNDEAKVGRTATLAVTPKQAEILLLAVRMGDLSLTLRGLSDSAIGDDKAAESSKKPVAPAEITTDVEVSGILSRLHMQNQGGGTVKNVRIYNSVAVDSRIYAVGGPVAQSASH